MATEALGEETSKSEENSSKSHTEQQTCTSSKEDADAEKLIEVFGRCKWFNVAKGYGFITPEANDSTDSPKDVFVYQSNIQMSGFRSLREGERVRVLYTESHLGYEAKKVCGPSGEDCIGSEKRPKRRKRPDRCYNCGDSGHHAKECEHPPLPKRCHNCKAVEHLVADCPVKRESHFSESASPSSSRSPPSEQSTSPLASSSTSSKLT